MVAAGANTPWYVVNGKRDLGTSAASRAIKAERVEHNRVRTVLPAPLEPIRHPATLPQLKSITGERRGFWEEGFSGERVELVPL